uniref:UDENN domain-containing protein n=1 Tax=Globisporangium ultimum (strain ATCC 200006 / CBS 805.95 / DAOM BR144) TaxID=431595 RepID=K3W7L9_GLOUD
MPPLNATASSFSTTVSVHIPTPLLANEDWNRSQSNPFWVQDQLFELFLFRALQNVSSKVLWITCYQFKNLLQKATIDSSFQKKKVQKLEFDTRVVLAFKSSAPNSSGAGANFDEFLDALVNVAGFMFPKLSSLELAFEKLMTQYVIPTHQREFEYTGVATNLSWTQVDEMLAKNKVKLIIHRFAKTIGDLAASYSSTIGGPQHYRGLQFHEFSKFVLDIKPKAMPLTTNDLCRVFLYCCRMEVSAQYSESTTLVSLHFSSNNSSKSTSTFTGGFESSKKKNNSRATMNVTTGGIGGPVRQENDTITDSGGALEITCGKMMGVFGYLALIAVPQLVKTDSHLRKPESSTLRFNSRMAMQSIKALLHHSANHLSGKGFQNSHKHAAFGLARVQFLHEFHKLHQEDAMEDYLSSLTEEFRELACQNRPSQVQIQTQPETLHEAEDNVTAQEKTDADESFDLHLNWNGEDDEGEESGVDGVYNERSRASSLDPHTLSVLQQQELEQLTSVLNEGDDTYSFLVSELQRHALNKRIVDVTNTIPQMLDIWVAAGQKYSQVLAYVEHLPPIKAAFLERFGCSLFVFALQLLNSTSTVYRYEELYGLTNARVYGIKSNLWDDPNAAFTMDLAMETLSLASEKLMQACLVFASQIESSSLNHESGGDSGQQLNSVKSANINLDLYERYLECLFHQANCLCAYGDILAHNTVCTNDYELGCALEEELETFHGDQERLSMVDNRSGNSRSSELYDSTATLSKSSSPSRFYREANRMLRFVALHADGSSHRLPLHRVHRELAMTQFKLATHLPRGCVAEKKMLEEALVNVAICQKVQAPHKTDIESLVQKKEYISAILVLRHKFFQPEGPSQSSQPSPDPARSEQNHRAQHSEESIAPFYRFVLAAAVKDFDSRSAGILSQHDLTLLNKACGRGSVSDAVMSWLLSNFDHKNNGLTEKGLLEYFCWIAEADPLVFCEVLDIFTAKYTETHHASITSSRPHISKEPKAKSLRSMLFVERRRVPSSSSARQTFFNKNGIAECVVVLSGKMTTETCGDLRNTKSPSDVRLEPEVVDVLPSNASIPDELSKFCFPDDVFLYDKPFPPKTFDIVLTEKDPMDVLALISNVQNGRTASLPSWISLKDIQQRKTQWKCFVPKCICVLSSHPLFQTFREFLAQLYRLSITTSSVQIPIESFVFNLVEQIPLPPTSLTQTSFTLADRKCLVTGCAPTQPPFYPTEVDFTILFQCLSPENILKVYGYLLTEKKLVVCSANCSILTPVAETLRALLHPFECQLVYIPVLPLSLLDFVSAPVPFFMGVRSDKRVDNLPSEGVIVVDLDKNEVSLPSNELMPSLPDVKAKKLLQALRKVSAWASNQKSRDQFGRVDTTFSSIDLQSVGQLDPLDHEIAQLGRRHDDLIEKWGELQSLFTAFAARLMKDFRKYCSKTTQPKEPNEAVAFDKRSFLTMHPSAREFCTHLFQTQLFQRFIEKNASSSESGNGAEQEPSWLSVRSMSVMWKSSESVDESTKTPPRQLIQAPMPFPSSDTAARSSSTTVTAHKRASQSTLEMFPVFNSLVYDEFLARNNATLGRLGTTHPPTTSPIAIQTRADEDSRTPVLPPTLQPSLSFHTGHSAASTLVTAARMRLEGSTWEDKT